MILISFHLLTLLSDAPSIAHGHIRFSNVTCALSLELQNKAWGVKENTQSHKQLRKCASTSELTLCIVNHDVLLGIYKQKGKFSNDG